MCRIAKIKKDCISNGPGLRTAIFFCGCPHHCYNCFNKELWNYNIGKEVNFNDLDFIWDTITEHTSGISFLGGEPLCPENINGTLEIANQFKQKYPDKTIYLWTGYTIEQLDKDKLKDIDVLIDGQFKQEEYEYGLELRGSRNQRILYKGKDF